MLWNQHRVNPFVPIKEAAGVIQDRSRYRKENALENFEGIWRYKL